MHDCPGGGGAKPFFVLDPAHTNPKRTKREREKARKLKASDWWRKKLAAGICHYCGGRFSAVELTMDHIVPVARGGESNRANIVPSCRPCNQAKRLETPVDRILRELGKERDK